MEVTPRLQLPPFPVQFKPDSPAHSFKKGTGAEWPAAEVGLTHSNAPLVEWNLKTDSETYLTTLESKLAKLATPAAAASTSKPDSGYASSSVFSPPQPFADLEDDMVVENGSYGDDGGEIEAESREGDGLLWGFAGPPGSASGDSAVSRIDERDEPLSDIEHDEYDHRHAQTPIQSTTGSPVQAYLIPPTPSSANEQPGSNDDREDVPDVPEPTTLEFRVPSTLVDTRSRRISFNSSVRISGGIGGRNSRPRAGADLFSPPPAHEKTRSASTSSTHSLPPNANSRSGSPTAPHMRTGSSGSQQQQPFQLSGYSSAATSAVPSRSSSPCSSIYAPLQPPSATCPSPMLVRPPPKRKSLTFTEYLRGRADDNEETAVKGYRDLVEAQRRKKTKWEQRRAAHARGGRSDRERSKLADGGDPDQPEGLWDKIKQMLASGAAGAGRRGGRSYSHYGGVDSTKRGRRRDSDDDDAGDDEDDEEGDRRVSTRGRGRGGRPPRRKPSALSLSSVSDADDEGESRDARSVVSDDDEGFYAGLPSTSRRMEKPKTPADVMFGPAPTRWSRWDWWLWKVRGAAASVYGDCFGRARSEDEEERV